MATNERHNRMLAGLTPEEQLVGGGLLAYIIIREVLDFIAKRKESSGTTDLDTRVSEIHANVVWLREIHDVKDADGVPVWYVRQSLEHAIEKLSESITKQTELLQCMLTAIKLNGKDEKG